MKIGSYLTIIFVLLLYKNTFAQSKRFIGAVSFELANIEKNNYLFKLGYIKFKQTNSGRSFSKYYFDIGYANQNNFNFL